VCGDDEFLVAMEAERAISDILHNNQLYQVEEIDGRLTSADAFRSFCRNLDEALTTMPLFVAEKIFYIKSTNFLFNVPTACDEIIEKIFKLFSDARELRIPIVIAAFPVDRRLRLFKSLSAISDLRQIFDSCADAARKVFKEEVDKIRLLFDDETRDFFLEKVGGDARRVAEELKKLDIFLGPQRVVALNNVSDIVFASPGENFFETISAFYRRDSDTYSRLVNNFFFENGEPRALLSAFLSNNRLLIQMKALQQLGILKFDKRGMPIKSTLEHGSALRRVKPLPGNEKNSCAIFDKNPWILKQNYYALSNFRFEELTKLQSMLLCIFTDLIREWQFVTQRWLVGKFVDLLCIQ
jgi:DNA polymerase III delta subunit